jgi:hypothetical protein
MMKIGYTQYCVSTTLKTGYPAAHGPGRWYLRDAGFREDFADLKLVEGARVGWLADNRRICAAARSGDSNHFPGHIQQTGIRCHQEAFHRYFHPLRETV